MIFEPDGATRRAKLPKQAIYTLGIASLHVTTRALVVTLDHILAVRKA